MNAPRHAGRRGHVESWFFRANHPDRPLACWLKVTILAPLAGEPVVETWLIVFDGVAGTTFAHRDTHPLAGAQLGSSLHVGTWDVDFAGTLCGTCGEGSFDLRFGPTAGARPLSILPFDWMLAAPFPRSKLLTPFPSLRFDGALVVAGVTLPVDGWTGMQGHNWGAEHAHEYAWGQCLFPGALVEGFTARVRVGGVLTPRLSAMVVRHGDDEYRFDRLLDTWRQEATISPTRWTLRMRGPAGEARLRMESAGRPMACLAYANPDGRVSYCFNSKLADTLLEVEPTRGAAFRCTAAHGGALEFLRHAPDPAIPVV